MDVPQPTFNQSFKHYTLMYELFMDHCSVFHHILVACKNNKIRVNVDYAIRNVTTIK